jgi:hypothetical protein
VDPPLPARRARLLRRLPGRARALINSFQHTDRRSRGRRAPAPQTSFAPENVPEHLQDDWYHEHFRRIGGNTRLLRRATALRLVQISAGGSLAEAAAFLGIDHRYLKASPGLAAFAGDPAEFRLAVHALARQLSATPELINYKHRRDALRRWCIDPAAWQDISQLPPTKGPFQPELSDCKRQFASEAIWARVTQGEHLLAPRIIEDQLSAGDPTWHRRRDNMCHFYLATPLKPHYAARPGLPAWPRGVAPPARALAAWPWTDSFHRGHNATGQVGDGGLVRSETYP